MQPLNWDTAQVLPSLMWCKRAKKGVFLQIVPRAFKIVPPLSKGPVCPSHLSPHITGSHARCPSRCPAKDIWISLSVSRWRRVKTSGPSPTASPSTLLRGPSSWLPGEEGQRGILIRPRLAPKTDPRCLIRRPFLTSVCFFCGSSSKVEMGKWIEDLNMAIDMAKKSQEKSSIFLDPGLGDHSNRKETSDVQSS